MKNFMTALCASAIALMPVAASAQMPQHMPHGGGGGGMHMPGGVFGGGGGGHGLRGSNIDRFRFNGQHSFRQFDSWRHRGRGNACGILGFGRGCVSIAEWPYLILSYGDDVYCYERSYGRPREIVCPYDDWYDY